MSVSVNTELFRRIEVAIEANPASHNQNWWEVEEAQTFCGTTRCVFGWAVYLATGVPFYAGLSRLFTEYGMSPLDAESGYSGEVRVGARLLGITEGEADDLFFADNDTARNKVKEYARS